MKGVGVIFILLYKWRGVWENFSNKVGSVIYQLITTTTKQYGINYKTTIIYTPK